MNVLAVATDAGGAANVAPVAALVAPGQRRAYGSGITERVFREGGVPDVMRWPDGQCAETVLDAWLPDVVLCGTTRYASPERDLVRAAGAGGVPVVVMLDEWYRYADRFRDSPTAELVLPDLICVPDTLARDEAVAEGLPRDRLLITGSPALSSLADRLVRFRDAPPEPPDFLVGLPHPWMVFLSETHAADFGSAPGVDGPLGPFLGFTEATVAADLAIEVSRIGRPCTVVEKLHPAASPADAVAPRLTGGQTWLRVSRTRLDALLWHADLVVGMRSMALLEAAMTGRPVLAYQPGLSPAYGPATSERLGLVVSAATAPDLGRWLASAWCAPCHPAPVRPAFANAGAAGRVRDALAALVARGILA